MEQKLGQSQKLEHGLALTPQLRKSLEILQSSAIDLEDIVRRELEANPLLEEATRKDSMIEPLEVSKPNNDEKEEAFDSETNAFDEDSSLDTVENFDSLESGNLNSKRDFFFNNITETESLQTHLLTQARIDCGNEEVCKAFDYILGLLDERGFLPENCISEAVTSGHRESAVLEAIDLLQDMEPVGIGAFDMRQSMLLQLDKKNLHSSLEYKILDSCYDLLLKRKVDEIASKFGCKAADIENAINEISKLSTSPARDFAEPQAGYITIDLIAYKASSGTWQAKLTDEYVPKLRINNEYRAMISKGGLDKSAQDYIKDKTKDGKFIIEAIENRQSTLKSVADAICLRQHDFFEHGKLKLKPLTMKDIADDLGIHATTVSRAVSEKYMQTPFGVFMLKSFFTHALETDGEDVSNSAVKAKIEEIVKNEIPQKPLSDAQIVEILKGHNMPLARRTVAKYREALGIAPKSLRKRF